MIEAIGLVELSSIARGIETADAMLKAAQVELIEAKPTCPGKYIVLIAGDVAAVQSSVEVGRAIGNSAVIDDFILPNVHSSVIEGLSATTNVSEIIALGIIETFSIASLIVAADTAANSGVVETVEIRIGVGIGGKSYAVFTGDVSSVRASVEAGAKGAGEKGALLDTVVIPSPHRSLKKCIL